MNYGRQYFYGTVRFRPFRTHVLKIYLIYIQFLASLYGLLMYIFFVITMVEIRVLRFCTICYLKRKQRWHCKKLESHAEEASATRDSVSKSCYPKTNTAWCIAKFPRDCITKRLKRYAWTSIQQNLGKCIIYNDNYILRTKLA